MDPSLLCQIFFSLGTIVSIGGTLFPSFKEQIMTYGSRSTTQAKHAESKFTPRNLKHLWLWIVSIQVPHSWFTHYYIISVSSSIFWASQFYTKGPALQFLALYSAPRGFTMTTPQLLWSWALMTAQGTRRLYESMTLTKQSQSQMWVGIWILGTAFYITMGISVWIEGIATIVRPEASQTVQAISSDSILSSKLAIALTTFIAASWVQHICHKQLAGLKKYSLPNQYFFQKIVCPHYTSECFIYLSIAIVSAPHGQTVNQTVFAGFIFVVSNLAVTAAATRNWYVEKFGEEKLQGRWRMIPLVY